jgi:hypothetical protein
MPATYSYPGVYIEEIPSGVRTITGVSTSNTAFVGYFPRGPMNEAVRIVSYADFERIYGGLDSASEASYAIRQYFLNGGGIAFVVRVAGGTFGAAAVTLQGGSPLRDTLHIDAANPGEWGRALRVAAVAAGTPDNRFNLLVREVTRSNGREQVVRQEIHRNLSMALSDNRYVVEVIARGSALIRAGNAGLGQAPITGTPDAAGRVPDSAFVALTGGSNGTSPADATAILGSQSGKTGLYALEAIAPEVFNLLCIPESAAQGDTAYTQVGSEATRYCEDKRAFLLVDIPAGVASEAGMRTWMSHHNGLRHSNAAVYFPRVLVPDPLNEFRPRNIASSGTMAGVYARSDTERGVWKAPAGTDTGLRGVSLPVKLNDLENGGLNPLGVNVLRTFPVYGNISWGARTLDGADQMASEWKYIPVRRTALFIEETLYQQLKWVVFEPNDEPLWSQIRLNVGAFMHNLFRQGAFQGGTPRDAYLVKCDSETTTQNDIDAGIVNILVGFAPLKPAEFVVIKIQQLAGQVQT